MGGPLFSQDVQQCAFDVLPSDITQKPLGYQPTKFTPSEALHGCGPERNTHLIMHHRCRPRPVYLSSFSGHTPCSLCLFFHDVSSAARQSKATFLEVAPKLFKQLQLSLLAHDDIDCIAVADAPANFPTLCRLCPDTVHTGDIARCEALHTQPVQTEVKITRVRNTWLEGSKPLMLSAQDGLKVTKVLTSFSKSCLRGPI